MSAELKASRRDATLILTISNPGTGNALHVDMVAAAVETLTTAERDDSIRCVVLTGADNVFCSGTVPSRLTAHSAAEADALDGMQAWIDAIRDCPKPVIAAVDGVAIGTGFSLALACDMIVASANAEFVLASTSPGAIMDGDVGHFLINTLPRQLAFELLVERKAIAADRLHALGVINRIAADGKALDAALAWSDELAALPPDSAERVKVLFK